MSRPERLLSPRTRGQLVLLRWLTVATAVWGTVDVSVGLALRKPSVVLGGVGAFAVIAAGWGLAAVFAAREDRGVRRLLWQEAARGAAAHGDFDVITRMALHEALTLMPAEERNRFLRWWGANPGWLLLDTVQPPAALTGPANRIRECLYSHAPVER